MMTVKLLSIDKPVFKAHIDGLEFKKKLSLLKKSAESYIQLDDEQMLFVQEKEGICVPLSSYEFNYFDCEDAGIVKSFNTRILFGVCEFLRKGDRLSIQCDEERMLFRINRGDMRVRFELELREVSPAEAGEGDVLFSVTIADGASVARLLNDVDNLIRPKEMRIDFYPDMVEMYFLRTRYDCDGFSARVRVPVPFQELVDVPLRVYVDFPDVRSFISKNKGCEITLSIRDNKKLVVRSEHGAVIAVSYYVWRG